MSEWILTETIGVEPRILRPCLWKHKQGLFLKKQNKKPVCFRINIVEVKGENTMKVTLKDGSVKEYSEPMSVNDIAFDIAGGLRRAACAGRS